MMKNSTSRSLMDRNYFSQVFAIILLLTLFSFKSYSQTKIYANSVTKNTGIVLGNVQSVLNPNNALTSDNTTFATIRSSGGVAIGIGSYSGELEIKFPSTLPAGTTSYVRIDFDPDVLNQLLAGNLGGLLANVVGGVALGDHSFEVGARNAAGNTVLSGSSSGAFTSSNLRLVRDAAGNFYVMLRPTQDYDRVYVRDITRALLLGTGNNTKFYNAFYTTGIDPCGQATYTGFEGNGLTVGVLGLGKAGVTNPQNAIDGNLSTYSELSLGALGVAGSISQNFYFNTPSNAGDDFNLRIQSSSALLTAGILSNISVTAYNGNTQVFTQSAANLLNLDVLSLLNSGQVATIPFSPGVPFDRVQVTLSSLVDANLTQTIFIYDLNRSAGRPIFTAPATNNLAICYNTTANLTATTPSTNELRWYDVVEGGAALATVPYNAAFTTPALIANKTYYVAARRIGCTEESGRVPVTITVNPAIIFNTTTLSNATIGFAYNKQIDVATGGTPSFTYALATGSNLPAGLTLSSSGLISGTPTSNGSFSFSITATDSKGCNVTANYTLIVTATLALTPGALPDGVTGLVYPAQTIPVATGGTGPYVYSATTLPPGLTFDPATRQVSGTPTQTGNYTIPVTVTDANGNSITSGYTIKITDPLILPAAALASGKTGTAYTPQTIPSATGGTEPYSYTAGAGLPPGLTFDPATRRITGTPTSAGTFTFPITVTDASGKTASSNYTIDVTDPLVMPAAVLPDGTEGVVYPTQVIPGATGGVGPYTYTGSNLPPGLSFNPTTREITGTPTQAGNYSVTVVVTDAQGNSTSTVYPLKVNGVLSLAPASLPNGTVGTTYPVQTLPGVTGGTIPYTYVATNLPPGLNFNTTTREISGTPTQGGTFVISVTATDANNNKVNTDYTIVVNVNPPVVAAVAVCADSPATLSVSNLQAGVTYNWYAATGNTALATNNSGVFISPPVSTATTFYVEAVSGTAVSAKIAVNVTINPAANPAVITTNNQVVNAGQSTTLSATADAGNTIRWYGAASGGTALASGSNFTTPALNTSTTYYVETTNASGCASNDRVPVTVTVVTGGGNTACNTANTQNSGITGICLLCSINGPGNSTDTDPNNFTRISLAVGALSTGYQQLIFSNPGAATDSIRLDLGLPTGLLDLSVLGNITVNVMSGTTVLSSYQLNSSLLKLSLLNGNRFTATVAAGAIFDRVELRFGGLVSAISSLDIYGATIIYPNPTLTSGSQTICAGSSATLTATANGGTSLKWYDAPAGGNLLASGLTYSTPNLNTTTTYYIEVSNGTCANVNRVPVVVTVTPPVITPVLAPIGTTCSGTSAVLSVSNPDPTLTYNWYTSANGGTPIFTGTVFTSPILTANATYYLEALNGNCISATRALASVSVSPRPVIPVVSASSSTINAGQTAILTASSSETDVNFNWYDAANSTTPIYSGATFVTPPLNTTTTYYVESVSNITGCTSTSRVQITVTVNGIGTPIPVLCESPISQTNGVTGVALLAGVSNPGLAIDNDQNTASSLVMPIGALGASVYQNLNFGSLSNVGDTLTMLVSSPGRLLSLSLLGNAQITTFNGGNSNNDGVLLNNNLLNVQLLSGNTQALITFVPTNVFDGVELSLNSGVVGALTSINLNYARRILLAPTVVSANVSGCAGSPATLQVSNPVAGFTYRWYDAALTPLTDGISYNTANLTVSTKYYVAAISPSGCISAKTVVNVTVDPAPAVPELLSATVNSCVGNAITLQVKNPVNGVIYRWYDNSNAVVLADGTTFTTPAIGAGTTIYKVASINSCGTVSATVSATINATGTVDPPVITPTSATIVAGTTTVLTATSTTAGPINWYDAPGAVVPIFTGTTYTTQPLFANTTYYVSVDGGICGSSARATVTVNVIPPTPNTADCGIATSTLLTGVTGVNLAADVINPPLAVDNDINTGSTLFIPAGVLNTSVFHRVGFTGGLSNVGDTLKIKISSPGNLLSAAVLPNITLTTYNGATSNADDIVLSNPLIQLDLLGTGAEATLIFVPTKRFDGVQLSLSSGLVGALTSINFDYARRLVMAPQVSSATASACLGSSAVLSVNNPQSNIIYKWYQGTVYQSGKDGATFLTDPTLAVGSYDFFVTATTNPGGCESPKIKIVATITAPPSPPVVSPGNPTTACLNTPVTLSIQPVANVVYNWYDAAAGGNMLASNSSSYTTPANLLPGVYNFYVEASSGSGCSNATRTLITLTVNQNAVASEITVTGNTSLCVSGVTTLTAVSAGITNPSFKWYSDAALTNIVSNNAIFQTPAISANTTYYVTVSGTNRCANLPGNAQVVNITINPPAVASDINLSGTSTICAGSGATLTASSTTVINPVFTWYNDAALTSVAQANGAVFNTPSLSAETTYYVTVRGDNRCENVAGTAKAITITINPLSTDSDISVSGSTVVCKNSAASLSASSTTISNPVFIWYSNAALTTVAHVGASFNTPTLASTTTYYVTVSGDNACANTPANAKVVVVTVKEYATAADISVSNTNICSGSGTTLMASSLTVTNPVFTWYSDASLTVPVFTGPSYSITSVTATTTYYVTVKGTNKCENAAADAKAVTITVNPLATTTDIIVSGNTVACTGNGTVLTASSASVTNPVFTWYNDAALTNIAYLGSVFSTPVLNASTTYYVTVKGDNKCENAPGTARAVNITISAAPSNPIISSTGTTICSGDITTLSIQNPQAGVTYEWYNAAVGGNLLSAGTSFTSTALTTSTTYYVQAIGAGGCANSSGRTMVVVTVNPKPVNPTVASSTVSVCAGSPAILSVSNPQNGLTYNWYTTATGGTMAGSGITFTSGPLNANTIYYVEAVSGSCTSVNRTPININVLPVPVAPALVSAANGVICSGGTTVLSVGSPDPTLTYQWFTVSSGGTPIGSGSTFTTPAITTTTIFYAGSVSAAGCASPTRTPVTVTVLPILATPVVRVLSTEVNSVTFAWNAVTGASGYEISINGGANWQLPSGGAQALSHTIAGLKPDQAVTLIVRAIGQIACQTSANSVPLTGKASNPLGNEIYIPNVFTPNNDGKNDTFLAYGTTIAKVRMNIYTQWGQLIFQTESTTQGWDGTYKGIAQPTGVYVFMIEVESTDGTKVMKKGTVTLIR
jgi:gliding motility-associated-like protein